MFKNFRAWLKLPEMQNARANHACARVVRNGMVRVTLKRRKFIFYTQKLIQHISVLNNDFLKNKK